MLPGVSEHAAWRDCIEKSHVKRNCVVENVKGRNRFQKVKTNFDEGVTDADKLTDVVTGLGYEVQSVKVK